MAPSTSSPRFTTGPHTLTGDGTPMVARTESLAPNRAKRRAQAKAERKIRAAMAKRRKGNR